MNLLVAQQPVYIIGPYTYLPDSVIDNRALIDLTKSDYQKEMISFSTGIRQRHWASDNQACSDLAIAACQRLLKYHPDAKADIKQLVLATISGDYVSPPTSPRVLYELGISAAGAMDLGAACAGFITGLHTSSALALCTNQAILLVASEIRSKFLDFNHFGSSVLFGDGAASAIVSTSSTNAHFKVIATVTYADGEISDTISIPAGGSRQPINEDTAIHQTKITIKNSTGLFVKAVQGMTLVAQKLLNELGIEPSQIDWLIPHQGNKHLVHSVAKQLTISLEKTIQTVTTSGNTSGASIGIALNFLKENLPLSKGQRILLTSAGGGGIAAGALLEIV